MCFSCVIFVFIFFTGFDSSAQGISSGVTFNWADTQTNFDDPATLESIIIDGSVYNSFVVPSTYELTKLGPAGHSENNIRRNGAEIVSGSDSGNWSSEALKAYQSLDLNYYFQSGDNGDNICNDFSAVTSSNGQIQTIGYSPGIPSNSDGVLAVTERSANNCLYIEVYGIPAGGGSEQFLGHTFVRNNPSGLQGTYPQSPPATNVDYWYSGRNNENTSVIGIALFKLSDLAPIGSIITAIQYSGATLDHGDGKFFLMQTYAQDDTFEPEFEELFIGDVSTNDNVPVGSTYSHSTGNGPFNGTLTVSTDGTFEYNPAAGFTGIDTFEIKLCLPEPNTSMCDISTVTLNVKGLECLNANSGFENGTTGYTFNSGAFLETNPSRIYEGDRAASLPAKGANVVVDNFAFNPNETLDVGFWLKETGNSGDLEVLIKWLDSDSSQISESLINIPSQGLDVYTFNSVSAISPVGTAFANIRFYNNIDDLAHIDSLCFQIGSKPLLSIDNSSAIEGQNMVFTISINQVLTLPLNIPIQYVNGTTTNSDFTGPTSVTLPAGETSVTFNVLAVNDDWVETSQEFTASISDPSGITSIIDTSGIGTIIDIDVAYITGGNYDITEGGTIQYKLVLSTGTNSEGDQYVGIEDEYTVDFSVENSPTATDPATDGLDFNGFSTTITFPAGSVTGTEVNIDIPTIQDVIIEPTEIFDGVTSINTAEASKYGTSPSRVSINNERSALRINDDDSSAIDGLSIIQTDVIVTEGIGVTATFDVTLTGNYASGFDVNFSTDFGTATTTDFTPITNGTISFDGNNNEVKQIEVTILNDDIIEPQEAYTITLNSTTNPLVPINNATANGFINDDDAPSASEGISVADFSVLENVAGGTTNFVITYTGPTVQNAFNVDFTVSNGSAIAGDDYTVALASDSVAFGSNTQTGDTQNVEVTIINDNVIEPNEDLTITLTGISTNLVNIVDGFATGVILNDDNALPGDGVEFTQLTVSELEGDTTADATEITFEVTYTGVIPAGETVTVEYTTNVGSADAADFTPNIGTIDFTDTISVQTITIEVTEETIIEADEDFTVVLSNLTTDNGFVTGFVDGNTTNTATGVILNDDNALPGDGVEFTQLTVSELEGDTTADTTEITFEVTYTGVIPAGETVTVEYTTNVGSADAADFTPNIGTIDFTDTISVQTITIEVTEETIIEADENFTVVLSNLTTVNGFVTGFVDGDTTNTATGVIINDDASDASEGISVADFTVTEDIASGTADFVITYTGLTIQDEFTVDFTVTDGSAISPDDYTVVIASGNVTFPAGTTNNDTQVVEVTIINDLVLEFSEDLNITLGTISHPLVNMIDDSAVGTITDNDLPDASEGISVADFTVAEDITSGMANFEVSYTGPTIQEEFTVDFTVTDGTAISPDDYSVVIASGNVTFPAGTTDSDIQNVAVTIVNDALIEFSEDLTITLGAISHPLLNMIDDTAIGTITDDDADPTLYGVEFDVTSIDVNEDAGTVSIDVVLNADVQDEFTVEYYTVDVTTTDGSDYTGVPQDTQTLTFGGTNSNTQTIVIPIIDDTLIEFTENFNIVLEDISSPIVGILSNYTTTVNIIDNDADPSLYGVQFDTTSVTVNEDAGTATLNVVLNADVQDEFTVEFYTVDGSAADASDYTGIPRNSQTLTFGGTNPNTQPIVIPIIDDILIEDPETFNVILENISSPIVGILSDNIATVTIIDNDGDEGWPEDITIEACDEIPDAFVITSDSDCAITVDYTELVEGQDDECATEYTITRTWTITDCVGNVRTHTQVITIEDTVAPTFNETLPQDMTVECNMVPDASTLTATDSCEPNIDVTFTETITNDENCALGYTVTRTWTATDCAGNMVEHTQVITVEPTGPIMSQPYEEEMTIICGDDIPEAPEMVFTGGCGNFDVVYNEETQQADGSDDYMIIRTWNVTDSCGNTASFEQIVFVLQPQLQEITINICIEEEPIDLLNYLPADFDRNGTFMILEGDVVLEQNFFDPLNHEPGEYKIAYSSTEGTCKYYVDFTVIVDTECVPCGRGDIEISKAVTANGDGVNDFFEIRGVEYCAFSFDVMIFNRWGTKIAEVKDYQNDWGGESPDGSFGQSGMLPTGTYYYIITATDKNTGTILEPFNGYIYIGTN